MQNEMRAKREAAKCEKKCRAKREATKCLSNKAVQCLSVAKMQNHSCMQGGISKLELIGLLVGNVVEEKMIQ